MLDKNKNYMYEAIVNSQHSLNKLTAGANYLDRKLSWNSPIIRESAELLESLGFEWWKKTNPDKENVKVETIDLLHFVTSETIQRWYELDKNNFIAETISELQNYFNEEDIYEELEDDIDNLSLEDLVNLLNYNRHDRFYILKQMFKKQEMDNETVYVSYITKNCLNIFRQKNGYKEGTYIKMWNGQEDNVIAFELSNKIGAVETLSDELYEQLTNYYNKMVVSK